MTFSEPVYVSITGLRVTGLLGEPRFWRHAIPAMTQAKHAPGNLLAEARTIGGIRHTLTIWESQAAMRRYLYRGAHRKAIRAFPGIGTGKTFGYLTNQPPAWDQVHQLWHARAAGYQSATVQDAADLQP